MSLKPILDILSELKNESKRTIKDSILTRVIESNDKQLFKKVVFYAYNTKKFKVRSIEFIDNSDNKSLDSIFDYLDMLSETNGCNNKQKYELSRLSSIDNETVEVVNRILKKDLRCGISNKTLQKYFPELAPHEVMLCNDDIPKHIKECKTSDNSMWSIKLDGTRCWAITKDSPDILYLSRNGFPVKNLHLLTDDIKIARIYIQEFHNIPNPVFDGEVISIDENFQKHMSELSKIESANPNIFLFHIFDIVVKDMPFIKRYNIIKSMFNNCKFTKLKLVEHHDWKPEDGEFNEENIKKICNTICNTGKEGVVFKTKSGLYKKGKSHTWCKVKNTLTLDLEVIRYELGNGNRSDLVGALICKLPNGNEVRVGSGLNKYNVKDFLTNTPKLIEVEFQDYTNDGSLRFPRFKRIREDK
jgi:DNA ligase-1